MPLLQRVVGNMYAMALSSVLFLHVHVLTAHSSSKYATTPGYKIMLLLELHVHVGYIHTMYIHRAGLQVYTCTYIHTCTCMSFVAYMTSLVPQHSSLTSCMLTLCVIVWVDPQIFVVGGFKGHSMK